VLQALCFDFQVRHPDDFVVKFIQRLKGKLFSYQATWFITANYQLYCEWMLRRQKAGTQSMGDFR
jgi:hypothetical protein